MSTSNIVDQSLIEKHVELNKMEQDERSQATNEMSGDDDESVLFFAESKEKDEKEAGVSTRSIQSQSIPINSVIDYKKVPQENTFPVASVGSGAFNIEELEHGRSDLREITKRLDAVVRPHAEKYY